MEILLRIVSFIFSYAFIPRSIGVIMDGNRRYAKCKKMEKLKGHEEGLSMLLKFIKWCIYFKVKQLSVYAFSIDNFNRSDREVEDLMGLFKKLKNFYEDDKSYFNEYKVKINVIGQLDFLPQDVREIIEEAVKRTSHYTKYFNII